MKSGRKQRLKIEGARALIAVAIVILTFGFHYRFFEDQKLSDPLDYWGDALFSAGFVKACEQGSYTPFLMKNVWTHGAPGIATWDDFPVPEQVPLCAVGWLARGIGLFAAINISFLGAMLAATIALYAVMRLFRIRWVIAVLFSAIYGISPYIVGRTVHHYNLVFYWYLPFVVLVCAWLASRRGITWRSPKFWVGVATAAVIGLHNPYYLNFSLQLFVLSGVAGHLRRGGKTGRGLAAMFAIIGVTVGTALLVNAHVIVNKARNGSNPLVAGRVATDLERFALKPIELVMPHQPHVFEPFQKNAARYDSTQRILPSERSYLGLIGALALLATLGAAAFGTLRKRWSMQSDLGLLAVWLMLYASPAGMNALTGLVGMTLFRSTNRASIVIMTLALIAAGRMLSGSVKRVKTPVLLVVMFVIAPVAMYEQHFPRFTAQQVASIQSKAASDRALVEQLQANVPRGARVFQLPVVGYPEESFEPFRPFFWSDGLKWSFAAMRGRPEAEWQLATSKLPPRQMADELVNKGFSAIWILGDGTRLFQAISAEMNDVKLLRSPDGGTSVILLPAR